MNNCWFCGEKITKKNESLEHIIPNAIFGKLKSKKILCKNCNQELSTLDTILDKSLTFITSLIDLKKDRKGKSKRLLMVDPKTGQKYILGAGFRFEAYNPTIEKEVKDDGTIENSFKGDQKQHKKYVESLKKKYPGRKIDVTYYKKEKIRPQLKDNGDISINIRELSLPILKIAINYYMHCNHDIKYINDAIAILKSGKNGEKITWYYYPENDVLNKKENCEILNLLFLKGDNQNRVLYCYISIYGALNFIICLNNNYGGPNFEETYVQNIKKGKVKRHINIDLSRKLIQTLFKERKMPTTELKNSLTELTGTLRSNAVHTHIKITLQEIIVENQDKNIDEIWKIAELEFNKIPLSDWKNWLLCAPHKKKWEQNKKCECGPSRFSFELTGRNDDGFKEVMLISKCKECNESTKNCYMILI